MGGWVRDGGSWYYLTASGAMATGWVNDGGSWYYLNASGQMATGWLNVGGSWYYLSPSGAMLTGTQLSMDAPTCSMPTASGSADARLF